jgi:hypothetical protein
MAAGREHRGEIKRSGQHADNRVGFVIERDRRSHDGRVGCKTPLPERVTQHDRLRATPSAFLSVENTSQIGLNTEHVEKIL